MANCEVDAATPLSFPESVTASESTSTSQSHEIEVDGNNGAMLVPSFSVEVSSTVASTPKTEEQLVVSRTTTDAPVLEFTLRESSSILSKTTHMDVDGSVEICKDSMTDPRVMHHSTSHTNVDVAPTKPTSEEKSLHDIQQTRGDSTTVTQTEPIVAADTIVPNSPNYPPAIYPADRSPLRVVMPERKGSGQWIAYHPEMDVIDIDSDEDEEMDEDEDEDEDDSSSEVSLGDDLKGDLESALEGDFDFKGNFAFSSLIPAAPNPGLHIAPLGLIGLPLSHRDALLIKSASAQAPFGHGEKTVVDTEVRDTWEIEPKDVKFNNPQWGTFVEKEVVKKVWGELGVAPGKCAPRCELYKLLLYEAGSHFLPHQDTEKSPGMFATVIIVLPSLYTGGQVHVSHGSSNKIFDLAPSSAFNTSLLAWYTDVVHEVKPINSGYRLALSYNLIHTAQGIPRPCLPDMHGAVMELRSVLRRWSKGGYEGSEDCPTVLAYLLKHEYSEVNLKAGALKGEDAHKISHLRGVAEEFDIVLGLANLVYNISGVADDDGGDYYKRSKYSYGSSSDRESTPGMMEEIDKNISVDNLVDLNGVPMMTGCKLEIEEGSLIPDNPFEDLKPDDTEYEGYMGNGAGTLEYWYRRTVLVLFREEDDFDVLGSGGVQYAVQSLTRPHGWINQPTAKDRQRASYTLLRLSGNDKKTARFMADLAVQWNDLAMWKQVVTRSGAERNIGVLGTDKFIQAWKLFSFEAVRNTVEQVLTESTSLKDKLDLINSLQSEASGRELDIVAQWCSEQSSRVVASLKAPLKDDVPVLLSIVLGKGVPFLIEVILPQLVKMTSIFDFWEEFIKSLHAHKNALLKVNQAFPAEQDPQAEKTISNEASFNNAMKLCLAAASLQWNTVVAQPRPSYPYHAVPQPSQAKVSRVIQIVKLCLLTGQLARCNQLFYSVVKSKEEPNLASKFQHLYNPLIAELRKLLLNHAMDLSAPPFDELCRILIGLYLQGILSVKPPQMQSWTIRKVGCGCSDCNGMDRFLTAPNSAEQTFWFGQQRRKHLESRLSSARDLVTYQTIYSGSPHGLSIKKRADALPGARWKQRQGQARAFLASIGDDAAIAKLMGSRYRDVIDALAGTKQFITASASNVRQAPRQPLAPSASINTVPPSTAAAASAPDNPTKKRDRSGHVILGPVIDLTGDDSS